jgi:lipopolysaccharide export system protein LptC
MPPPSRMTTARMSLFRLLRLVLPLGALVLLSTVFLVSRSIDPQRAVELADMDVTELAREPRIGTARIAGVTREDTALMIEAESVRSLGDLQQSGPVHLTLTAPNGALNFPSGRVAQFRSDTGELDQTRDQIVMRGGVLLETSDGYRLAMSELISRLQSTHVTGLGGIEGDGPAGSISADRVELTAKTGGSGGYLLAFSGNVRLIYLPED